MTRLIDLSTTFARFSEHFSPKLVANLNDHEIKLVKVKGEFIWHTHEADELFLVTHGTLIVQLRDGDVQVGPGQLYVVPRGVEHCPRADDEVHLILMDIAGESNTGDNPGERTADLDNSLMG